MYKKKQVFEGEVTEKSEVDTELVDVIEKEPPRIVRACEVAFLLPIDSKSLYISASFGQKCQNKTRIP